MSLVRAAVFDSERGLRIESITCPTPTASELLVDVVGCTLCGSDLHTIEGRRGVAGSTILGHEIVGRITELPSTGAVDWLGRPLRVGDHVTWAVVAACGACFYCHRDLPQKCLQSIKYGHQSLVTGRELYGGLAETCLLAPGTAIVKLPSDLPLAVACPASCATATATAAIEAAGTIADRNAVVFGVGMLGLTTGAMLRQAGANSIVCVDPDPTRRELAKRFGFTQSCAPEEFASLAAAICPHGFDIAIEMSGHNAAFAAAWQQLRIGGALVLVGAVFPSPPVPVELEQLVRRQITLRGIHNYAPRHLAHAVDFLTASYQKYPFDACVSEWYRLDELEQAVIARRDGSAIRVGVMP